MSADADPSARDVSSDEPAPAPGAGVEPVGVEPVAADGAHRAERERLGLVADRLRGAFPNYPTSYLFILVGASAIDGADRTILATVFEDIKGAFGVSDGQLGILTAAYSVVATLSVVPFGWIADRWHRVRLIALGFVPWSIAMIWTGAATSFAMMFVARLFLGTIEATNGPSTPSLLGDYYPVRRRSRVMGIFGVGNIIGSVMGFALGGLFAGLVGWRGTFFVFGGLGFACGALVLKLLPEPRRGLPDAIERVETAIDILDAKEAGTYEEPEPTAGRARVSSGLDYRKLTVKQATKEILRVRTIWIVFAASAIGDFFMSGVSTWAVTYFRRYHGLGAAPAGVIAATLALSTVGSVVIFSRIGDRLLVEGRAERRLHIAAAGNVIGFFAVLAAFRIENLAVAIPAFLVLGFSIGVQMPMLMAVSLDTLVSHLRGRANAVRSLLRVAGTALAPILFGFLSDAYGLRAAFLATAPFMLASGIIVAFAARTYVRDMEFAQAESVRQHEIEDAEEPNRPGEVLDEVEDLLADGK